jgi:hypothetical protein
MHIQLVDTLPSVRATLNYLVREEAKPYSYTYEPPAGLAPRRGTVDAVADVRIEDARPIRDKLSVDVQGFQLVEHETRVRDFYAPDEVTSVYYPEVEGLLKAATGAEKVVIFDHTVRSLARQGAREPVLRVHNDYTLSSGPRRVRDHLPADEAEARLRARFAEVNVWRPIRGPLESQPLAVCDARSIAPTDFIASDLIYPDRVGETYAFAHNPAHRWYYVPRMQRNEALLIKGYDSKEFGTARFTAHTGFEDPTTPASAPPRESIEVRALIFFPPRR